LERKSKDRYVQTLTRNVGRFANVKRHRGRHGERVRRLDRNPGYYQQNLGHSGGIRDQVMWNVNRTIIFGCLFAFATVANAPFAFAQSWPARSIKLVVLTGPGAATDVNLRANWTFSRGNSISPYHER
jgi:hypothetical protein